MDLHAIGKGKPNRKRKLLPIVNIVAIRSKLMW